jgi:hypothetical protein
MEIKLTSGRAGAASRFLLLATAVLILVAACSRPGAQPSGDNPQHRALTMALDYSKCMRSHGVPDYPDPVSHGNSISISVKNVDPNSPQFKAAANACRKYQPGPGNLSPQQQAQARKDGLKMADCMHAHGFPTFPDPDGQGVINITPSDGLNTNSPQYQSAVKVCQQGQIMISQTGPGGGSGSGSSR